MSEQQHHFFISTFTDWVVADTMIEAVMSLPRMTTAKAAQYIAIWRIPLPKSADYRISNYAPEVENAELVYLFNGDEDVYTPCGIRTRKGPHWVVMEPGAMDNDNESV